MKLATVGWSRAGKNMPGSNIVGKYVVNRKHFGTSKKGKQRDFMVVPNTSFGKQTKFLTDATRGNEKLDSRCITIVKDIIRGNLTWLSGGQGEMSW